MYAYHRVNPLESIRIIEYTHHRVNPLESIHTIVPRRAVTQFTKSFDFLGHQVSHQARKSHKIWGPCCPAVRRKLLQTLLKQTTGVNHCRLLNKTILFVFYLIFIKPVSRGKNLFYSDIHIIHTF